MRRWALEGWVNWELDNDVEDWFRMQALETTPALISCGTSSKCCYPLKLNFLTRPWGGDRAVLMRRL